MDVGQEQTQIQMCPVAQHGADLDLGGVELQGCVESGDQVDRQVAGLLAGCDRSGMGGAEDVDGARMLVVLADEPVALDPGVSALRQRSY